MAERWATFDCYGTLIDWDRGLRGALSGLWPDADGERLVGHYHAVEPRVEQGRSLPYREVQARSLAAVAAIDDLPLEPADRFALAASLPSWPPFPEVPQALRDVRRRGWRLVILSNVDPDLLTASLRRIGVPMDLTVTVAEAGSYKPAHGHWKHFFAATGADRTSCVHVAASPFHDLGPAAELGVPAVWVNRRGQDSDLPRSAEVADLARLGEVLEQLLSAP